jgi:aspartyl protease family protein
MNQPLRHPSEDVAPAPNGPESSGPTSGVKIAIVWLVVGTLMFLAVQGWISYRERPMLDSGGVVTLQRSVDGHYHWPGRIGERAVTFMVDTGATSTVVPESLARELGLSIEPAGLSNTAGGVVSLSQTRATVELRGGPTLQHWRLGVLSRLDQPLLGMDVLGKLSITTEGNVMRLAPRTAAR